jgi:hypothetical protein
MNKLRKGDVLYKRESGSTIRYASGEGDSIRAYIQSPEGDVFEEKSLGALLARGYWEPVAMPEVGSIDSLDSN